MPICSRTFIALLSQLDYSDLKVYSTLSDCNSAINASRVAPVSSNLHAVLKNWDTIELV